MKKLITLNKVQIPNVLLKMCLKKQILTLLILCSLVTTSVQANDSFTKNDKTKKQDNEWTLLKEVSGIKVYYKISKCESQDLITNPTNFDPLLIDNHETFALKFVNENSTSKTISFSKITRTDGSDEMQAISLRSGATVLESCESAAKLILSKKSGDNYPISVTEFLQEFKLTINN